MDLFDIMRFTLAFIRIEIYNTKHERIEQQETSTFGKIDSAHISKNADGMRYEVTSTEVAAQSVSFKRLFTLYRSTIINRNFR